MWGKLPGGCRAAAGTACVCADLCLAAACSATTTTTTTTPLLPLPCGTPTAAALTTAPPVWRCRAQVGFPGRPHGGARALHQHVSTPGVAQPLPWPRGSAGRRGGAGGGVLGPCRRRGRPSGIRWNQEAAHPPSPQLPWGVLLRDPGAARRGPSNAVPSANHFWRPAPPQPPDLVAPPFRAPPSRFHPPQHWFLVTTPITPPPPAAPLPPRWSILRTGPCPTQPACRLTLRSAWANSWRQRTCRWRWVGAAGPPPGGGGGGGAGRARGSTGADLRSALAARAEALRCTHSKADVQPQAARTTAGGCVSALRHVERCTLRAHSHAAVAAIMRGASCRCPCWLLPDRTLCCVWLCCVAAARQPHQRAGRRPLWHPSLQLHASCQHHRPWHGSAHGAWGLGAGSTFTWRQGLPRGTGGGGQASGRLLPAAADAADLALGWARVPCCRQLRVADAGTCACEAVWPLPPPPPQVVTTLGLPPGPDKTAGGGWAMQPAGDTGEAEVLSLAQAGN
jgi:hypothetical protein